jgi:hypothetical protein
MAGRTFKKNIRETIIAILTRYDAERILDLRFLCTGRGGGEKRHRYPGPVRLSEKVFFGSYGLKKRLKRPCRYLSTSSPGKQSAPDSPVHYGATKW